MHEQRRRTVPKCFSFDPRAIELLDQMVPTSKGHGAYLSRLIFVEFARQQERDWAQREDGEHEEYNAVSVA